MIGHKKFAWQTGIPLAAEWFDYDREEIDMEFDPDTQPLDDLPVIDEDMEFVSCDVCGECELEYMGEHYDEEQHLGSSYKCANCGHNQNMDDDDPDWYEEV